MSVVLVLLVLVLFELCKGVVVAQDYLIVFVISEQLQSRNAYSNWHLFAPHSLLSKVVANFTNANRNTA